MIAASGIFSVDKAGSAIIIWSAQSNSPLAQLVEQFPYKEWVGGSSPSGTTSFALAKLLYFRFSILVFLFCGSRLFVRKTSDIGVLRPHSSPSARV